MPDDQPVSAVEIRWTSDPVPPLEDQSPIDVDSLREEVRILRDLAAESLTQLRTLTLLTTRQRETIIRLVEKLKTV